MDLQKLIGSVPHWYHRFEFAPGVVTPGVNDSRAVLDQLDLPDDLTGLRVLDIGARDGYFSFECERRGAAEVIAIDYFPAEKTGFPVAKQVLGSRLDLVHENIYNLTAAKYGKFDIVLFLGLLYHLPDPLLALDIIHDLMKPDSTLYMETVVIDHELPPELAKRPLMEFYPGASKSNDHTNYWGITERCGIDMLEEYRFSNVATKRSGERGLFIARKASSSKDYYASISRSIIGGTGR